MHLEIAVDYDTEEIHMVLDDHITLCVRRDIDGELTYSKNFDSIIDDATYLSLKEIVKSIARHHLP